MKRCCACKKEKDEPEFYKNRYECKLCSKDMYEKRKHILAEKAKYNRKNNPEWVEKEKERGRQYRIKNRELLLQKEAEWRKSMPSDVLKERTRRSYLKNRDKIRAKSKEKREKNIDEARRKSKETYAANKERILENAKKRRANYYPKRNEQARVKRKENPLYRLKTNLRCSIYKSFARIASRKPTNTNKILGTDYDTVKFHIESKFTEGMSWENYGKWDVDHIIPLASAKTPDELLKLCHYSNLQPLWEYDNIIKGHKMVAA